MNNIRWIFDAEINRNTTSGFDKDDIGGIALQKSDNTLWMLTKIDPIEWIRMTTSNNIGFITAGEYPPDNPKEGDIWIDTL